MINCQMIFKKYCDINDMSYHRWGQILSTTFLKKLFMMNKHVLYAKHIKHIRKELLYVAWHPTRWWDWYMSE